MQEEKKISRYDIATVKRCYLSTKRYRAVRAKLILKKEALEAEIAKLDETINGLDAPARTLCGLDSEAFLIQQGILQPTAAPATEQPAEPAVEEQPQEQPTAEEERLTD